MKNGERLPRTPDTGPYEHMTREEMVEMFNERTGLSVTEEDLAGDNDFASSPPVESLPDPREDERLLFYPEDFQVTEEEAIRHHFNLYWRSTQTEGEEPPGRGTKKLDFKKRLREVEGWLSRIQHVVERLTEDLSSYCGVTAAPSECLTPGLTQTGEALTNRQRWDRTVREVDCLLNPCALQPDPAVEAIGHKLFHETQTAPEAPPARKFLLLSRLRSAVPLLEILVSEESALASQSELLPNKGGRPAGPDALQRRRLVERLATVRKGRFVGKIPFVEVFKGEDLGWPELPCLTGPRMALPLHSRENPEMRVLLLDERPLAREDLFVDFVLQSRHYDQTQRGAFLEPADIGLLLQASRIEAPSADPEDARQVVKNDLKSAYRRLRLEKRVLSPRRRRSS